MPLFETLEHKIPAKLVAAVGLGLGILTMAGCGASAEAKPGSATVIERDYDAAYTTVTQVGKVPVVQYHPADYDLTVEQCGRYGDEFADDRGCVRFDIDVSEETYNKHPEGSIIMLPLTQ